MHGAKVRLAAAVERRRVTAQHAQIGEAGGGAGGPNIAGGAVPEAQGGIQR